jgi:hypothetical protein
MNVWTMTSEDCELHIPVRGELQGCPICLMHEIERLRAAPRRGGEMSDRPKTLQELLATMEIAREHGAEYDWASVLRRILHGTDTEPGLVERVVSAADRAAVVNRRLSMVDWQDALASEIGPSSENGGTEP